jgi:hypothetical protein
MFVHLPTTGVAVQQPIKLHLKFSYEPWGDLKTAILSCPVDGSPGVS